MNNDGVVTVLDLAEQIAITRGQRTLSESEKTYADVNRDGVFNSYDTEAIVRRILGTEQPSTLPLAAPLETSPAAGETGVALTREFVVRFTMPLALDAVVTTHNPNTGDSGNLYAEFGGKKLLTRAELSSDWRKATLFFLEPLPASARVRVTFKPDGLKDLLGREIDANADGIGGGSGIYDFDTLSISGLASVGVVGTVYGVEVGAGSSTKVPLSGVTITVDGAEETLRTTTGADGRFVLTPAPAGRFFVLIDGRTAAGSGPNGYYTFVGKAWEGVPGHVDTPATPASGTNEAGDIFLPFIPTGTLQTVSATQDTSISFHADVLAANPGLSGVQITVPANSLFADNGARGGMVGIAAVSPDRLPEPLPPGLNFPLVITVQSDGATNFDRPVPVRFPNLPDPLSGEKLSPGAKSAWWSFNHDSGQWEIVGPMTVTADGMFVETDPGVGVRQPGWGGAQDGSQGNGPKKKKRKKKDEDPPQGCEVRITAFRNEQEDTLIGFSQNEIVTFKAVVGTPGGKYSWSSNGRPLPGSSGFPSYEVQFDTAGSHVVRLSYECPASPDAEPSIANAELLVEVYNKSGVTWEPTYPKDDSPSLTGIFDPVLRRNARAFLDSLEAAGATVRINSVYRSAPRQFLMHYSWQIAVMGLDARKAPTDYNFDDWHVKIAWAHYTADGTYDRTTSKSAASNLLTAFNVGLGNPVGAPPVPGSANSGSRHARGLAMDVSIGWVLPLQLFKNGLPIAIISSQPQTGGKGGKGAYQVNADLVSVARQYFGLYKLSDDGGHYDVIANSTSGL